MIRLIKEQDLPEILDIYNDAIVNTTAVYTDELSTMEERRSWMRQKEVQQIPIFVYEEEGRVAGFATYGPFRAWPLYKYTVEHSIYVRASYRQKGIASQLLERLIKEAKEKGYHTLIAGIDSSNSGSFALHQKYGFVEVGVIKEVAHKFDRWLDLVFLQKFL
ncbi:N-acetyltransferase [Staphylococcus felis]|uniref:GNAT family N-acetyltransferase n=1 Tax=Staphylococcus felis TaxID=46127 RepID=UPI000E2791C3|nr:GNAT family N-acetyltransferase [Staphylococcus felis]REH80952.1 N-acetyltransferase [Staphylococcus felis]REI25725.1 N-acetyltransferase [Staphylococcus felis]REI32460.1 N-acetyltransferase [Staphylococcus felis]